MKFFKKPSISRLNSDDLSDAQSIDSGHSNTQLTSDGVEQKKIHAVGIETLATMQPYPELPFQFNDLPFVIQKGNNNEKIYLFTDNNRIIAKTIILSLNEYIDEAKLICSSIGPNRILENDLEFDPIGGENEYAFDYFRVDPTTSGGKFKKYPLSISFNHHINKMPFWENNIFGEVFLLQNGDIGKGKINQWYKNQRNSIILTYENGKTIISKVEQ